MPRSASYYASANPGRPAKSLLWALLFGFVSGAVFTQLNSYLIWVCFVPIFRMISSLHSKAAFKAGLCFGGALGTVLFWWMVPASGRFTGTAWGISYGVAAFVICCCLYALYFALMLMLCRFFSLGFAVNKKQGISPAVSIAHLPLRALAQALLVASIFVLSEFLLQRLTGGLPWLHFQAGLPLSTSLVLIQPVSIFGAPVLTFVVICFNQLLSGCLEASNLRLVWLPLCVLLIYGLLGFALHRNFVHTLSHLKSNQKQLSLATLTTNTPAKIKWDSVHGNQLAGQLLDLSQQVARIKPGVDIALWSESALPWTYQKGDDLTAVILQNTRPAHITHLLGINTATLQPNVVYNSIYAFSAKGKVIGRYDKQRLLTLIEKPLFGWLLPFMSSAGFSALPGPGAAPLSTPFGKIGILICNETTNAALGRNQLLNGATFFCAPGNDGWFVGTYLSRFHFFQTRLRAVETRKDFAVNTNMGLSGLIQATGQIKTGPGTKQPAVRVMQIQPNSLITFVSRWPYLLLLSCAACIILAGFYRFKIQRSLPAGQKK